MILEKGYLVTDKWTAATSTSVLEPKPIRVGAGELRRHEHGAIVFEADQASVEQAIHVWR
jgi:hypothetical protein